MTTMNKLLISLVLGIFLIFPVYGQTAPAAGELTGLLNEFLAGAGRNDAAVHERFWADDLIYTRSAGSRIGKAELMKGVRSAAPSKADSLTTVFTAEEVQVRQYGNTAVVAFRLVATGTDKDGAKEISSFLNTGTFVKRRGKWQAVAWQATAVPKPAPTN